MCHADKGPAFPLETYDQTWLKSGPIHDQVIGRHMPPWAAVSGYGQFANDNSLTLRETQFIVSWVEGLVPRNSGTVFLNVSGPDAARPPEVRTHIDIVRWQLREPQLKFAVPAEHDRTASQRGTSHRDRPRPKVGTPPGGPWSTCRAIVAWSARPSSPFRKRASGLEA